MKKHTKIPAGMVVKFGCAVVREALTYLLQTGAKSFKNSLRVHFAEQINPLERWAEGDSLKASKQDQTMSFVSTFEESKTTVNKPITVKPCNATAHFAGIIFYLEETGPCPSRNCLNLKISHNHQA